MDKGRTGSQGPLEEPDENIRRSRPQRRPGGQGPIDRRRVNRQQRPTGPTDPAGSTGRIGPNPSGAASRRLKPQQPPEEMPGTNPPIRRASRSLEPPLEPEQDTPPRSRPLNDPGRRSVRPQQPLNEPEEEYYERRPRPRRPRPEPEDFEEEEEDYHERRPRSRRLPEDVEDDEVYYERRPLPRRPPPEPEDFEEEEEYYEPRPRSQRLAPSPNRRPATYRYQDAYDYGEPRRKRRGVLSTLLIGCGLVIFTLVLAAGVAVFLVLRSTLPQTGGGGGGSGGSSSSVSQQSSRDVLLSSVTRIQVCNKIGNVTLATDAKASKITVTTKKTVPSNNPAEFGRIKVEIAPLDGVPGDLTCQQPQTASGTGDSPLIINTVVPKGDSVDVTVILPPGVFSSVVAPMSLNIEALSGDISITDLSTIPAIMYVLGNNGNITMKNVFIGNNSQIRTDSGNLTFSGAISIPTDQSAPVSYKLQCGQGNIDASFLPGSTNVTLDASTNIGTIKSDFNNNIQIDAPATSGGKAGAHTPTLDALDPSQKRLENVFLHLIVNLGNIVIHKVSIP